MQMFNLNNKGFIVIVILYTILSGLLLNADLPIVDEEPFYFLLSKSIVSGQGYRDIFYPGNPFNTEYPPFYPSLMALVLMVFPNNMVCLKIISILFGIASLVIIYSFFCAKYDNIEKTNLPLNSNGAKPKIFKLQTTTINKFLLLLFVCTNPLFLSYSVRIVAEMGYLLFSLISIFFLEKYSGKDNSNKSYLLIGIISLIFAFYTKMMGLSLVLAILLYFFIKKKYKEFWLIGGISFFCFSPWIIRNILVSGLPMDYLTSIISGYKTSSSSMPKLIFWNIINYGYSIKDIFLPGCFLDKLTWELPSLFSLLNRENYFSLPFPALFSIFLISIIFFGFYLKTRKRLSLVTIYVLCYLAVLLLCPYNFFLSDGKRYLYQILPFLTYYFVSGLSGIEKIRFLHCNIKKIIIGFFVLIVIIPNLMCDIHLIKGNINYLLNYRNLSKEEKADYYAPWFNVYFLAASWVKERLPLSACIMHYSPYTFYLYSGHKTIWFPLREQIVKENLEHIKEKEVDYIIIGTKEKRDLVKKLNMVSNSFVFIPIVSFVKGHWQEGFSLVYKIISVDPKIKKLYQEGGYYYVKKDYNQARLRFEKALKFSVDLVGYYNLGIVYEKMGLINEAISMYQKALKIEPNFQIVENRLNILCQQEFLRRDGENLIGYKKLGDCYLKNYDYREAIDCYAKYLEISKKQGVSGDKRRREILLVHYNLGKAYLNQGDYSKTIKEFKKSFKETPEFKYKIKHYIKVAKQLKKRVYIYQ